MLGLHILWDRVAVDNQAYVVITNARNQVEISSTMILPHPLGRTVPLQRSVVIMALATFVSTN